MSKLQYFVDRKPSLRTDRGYTKHHKTTLDHLDNTVTSRGYNWCVCIDGICYVPYNNTCKTTS